MRDRVWDANTKTSTVSALSTRSWLERFAKTFTDAQLQKGEMTTDLHTGRQVKQLRLF